MPPNPAISSTRDSRLAAALCAIGLAASIICGRVHTDGILHYDDLTHYLFARWAWTWPRYLLHDWGRPGFTILYFLPAGIGWGACRILSALLTAASAWLAFRLAQSWRIPAAWAVIPLCYAQPLFFQLSQTTLTETPLAFYLIASIYAADKNRWSLSAALLSLTFITRHEAIIFLPVYLLFALRAGALQNPKSKIQNCLILLWAPLTINFMALLTGVTPSIKLLFEPHATSQYGRGGWLTYFARSMEAFGPGIMLLAMVGLVPLWNPPQLIPRSETKPPSIPPLGLSLYAIRTLTGARYAISLLIVFFLTQTTLRALGLYASGGYARFLVPVSPIIAICALLGWHALRNESGRRTLMPNTSRLSIANAACTLAASMLLLWLAMERQIALFNQSRDVLAEMPQVHHAKLAVRISTAVIVLLCVLSVQNPKSNIQHISLRSSIATLILLAVYALIAPLQAPPLARDISHLHSWLASRGYADRPVISANVWVDYVWDHRLAPDHPTTRRELEVAPPGALFIWDRKFAPDDDHRVPLAELTDGPQWRSITRVPATPTNRQPDLAVFEKITP